jgi:hypothetical protein
MASIVSRAFLPLSLSFALLRLELVCSHPLSLSQLILFFVEFFSHRWGKAKLEAAGFGGTYDNHGHDIEGGAGSSNHCSAPTLAAGSSPASLVGDEKLAKETDSETTSVDDAWRKGDAVSQILVRLISFPLSPLFSCPLLCSLFSLPYLARCPRC